MPNNCSLCVYSTRIFFLLFFWLPNTWRWNRGIIVGSDSTVDFPVVVAEVVGSPVTLAVHQTVLASLLGVGSVHTLNRWKKKKNLKVIKGKTICLKIKSLTLNLVFDGSGQIWVRMGDTRQSETVSKISIFTLRPFFCNTYRSLQSQDQEHHAVATWRIHKLKRQTRASFN